MSVLYWIPSTVFELILLVLSVRKGAEFWWVTAGLKGFKLMHVLIRDQVVYFAPVLVCGVVNVILIYISERVAIAGAIFMNLHTRQPHPHQPQGGTWAEHVREQPK
ncbi:hypothetical protein M0805_002852 [Coniferiporia weirii]|nr:hypothetical protein M0805_002852 [Coniferiporia weirii]